MKHIVFSILPILLFTSPSFATDLMCDVKINMELVLSQKVKPRELNEKNLIGKNESITAYITEKSTNVFVIEAFLGEYEARIYSETSLKIPGEKLTASLWGRDIILDIECTRLN